MKSFAQSLSKSHVGAGLLAGLFLVLLTYFSMSEQFAIRIPNFFSQPSTEHEIVSIPPAQDVEQAGSKDAVEEIEASRDEPKAKSQNFKKEEEIKEEKKTPESLENTQQLGSKNVVEEIKAGGNHEAEPKSENFKKEEEIKEEKKTPESLENTQQLGGGDEKSIQPVKLKPICDTTDPRCDVCDMTGDARILGSYSTVLYVPPPEIINPEPQEWKIRVQSRKYLDWIKFVTIKSLRGPFEAPPCTVRHNVPAVVFALGGLIWNTWHAFSDVIVPLYLTSRQFDGEVQFVITDLTPWWVEKYSVILKKLSRYEIIDFDNDKEFRCYPRALVGLRSHRDFGILPDLPPKGYTMLDFRLFMREAYSLPKDVPRSYRDRPQKKPRLMLINREKSRRWMNVEEVAKSVEELGFEVVVVEPKMEVNLTEFAKVVDSCDGLMGVHGAGLTNIVFLRTNATLIQVVPYGKLEFMAEGFFGWATREMKLRYFEYTIRAEESSLMEKYGRDDPVIKDPDSIHKRGWQAVGEIYMHEQDVKLNVTRFAPTLLKALQLLRE